MIKELAKQTNYATGCKDIYEHYGESKQLLQLVQECSELIKAITKGDKDNFIEELTDVQILIDQFRLNNPEIISEMDRIKEQKILRTLKRITTEGK